MQSFINKYCANTLRRNFKGLVCEIDCEIIRIDRKAAERVMHRDLK